MAKHKQQTPQAPQALPQAQQMPQTKPPPQVQEQPQQNIVSEPATQAAAPATAPEQSATSEKARKMSFKKASELMDVLILQGQLTQEQKEAALQQAIAAGKISDPSKKVGSARTFCSPEQEAHWNLRVACENAFKEWLETSPEAQALAAKKVQVGEFDENGNLLKTVDLAIEVGIVFKHSSLVMKTYE